MKQHGGSRKKWKQIKSAFNPARIKSDQFRLDISISIQITYKLRNESQGIDEKIRSGTRNIWAIIYITTKFGPRTRN
jgi:hypothetical protein